ncbi:DUF2155 domain-containing protein [Erythrobacter sp. WH158]|uniref:DUF2155 domain-containing protein n=2 Tax=Erythrobacter crassostreae TaxID=2828328 RepID=A0A9X1F2D3_9SPHN|nr:DUF2155 domain-containing protein [Erythrobacter crassostrea]MBV7259032.1 DUF2155 domain-containing protein [Erythrobacter crassostrea]
MRRLYPALLIGFALTACGSEPEAPQTVEVPLGEAADAEEAIIPTDTDGVTPNAERVATLGLLNKRNNISEDIEMKPGETREIGPVILTLASCERTAAWEMPQETGAFVQVDILDRGQSDHARVFSGWLFKESPSMNVVEHPIYDVWVKDCAMSWPGE